jgi:hypothetical protein
MYKFTAVWVIVVHSSGFSRGWGEVWVSVHQQRTQVCCSRHLQSQYSTVCTTRAAVHTVHFVKSMKEAVVKIVS